MYLCGGLNEFNVIGALFGSGVRLGLCGGLNEFNVIGALYGSGVRCSSVVVSMSLMLLVHYLDLE